MTNQAAQQPRPAPNARSEALGLTLELPVPPSANRWHRKFRNRTVLSDEAKAYTQDITALMANLFSRSRPRVVAPAFRTETLKVEIRWYRKQRSGDVDKRGAILLDALQGLAYVDDKQIADYRIVRDDSQPKHARMVVTIQPIKEAA